MEGGDWGLHYHVWLSELVQRCYIEFGGYRNGKSPGPVLSFWHVSKVMIFLAWLAEPDMYYSQLIAKYSLN